MVLSNGVISMYNQEVKMRFITERYGADNDNASKIALFRRIAPIERELNRDVAEFSESDARIAVANAGIIEKATLEKFRSLMKIYSQWCSDCEVFQNVTANMANAKPTEKDLASQVSAILFKDEEDLIRSMKKVRPFFDEGRLDVVIVAMAWIGIEKARVLEILDSEVDLDGRTFYDHDGRVLVSGYSDTIADIFHQYNCCNEAIRRTGTGERIVYKDRSLPFFLKNFYKRGSPKMGVPMRPRAISSFIEDINVEYMDKGYESRFTFSNIQLSGRLNRLFALEESGVDVMSEDNRDIVESIFDGSKKYDRIIWIYASYKRAFNL